jgi:GNAT superfamily N-acetyltransferase
MTAELRIRRYEPRDADPVWTLHEWALRDAGTDPEDVPGIGDLRRIEATYLDAGGSFLLGVRSEAASSIGRDRGEVGRQGTEEANQRGIGRGNGTEDHEPELARCRPPRVDDGVLVAMGGYLPCAADGSDGERESGPGAAELHRMRVAPTHQRSGYGGRLLAALERRARTAGFDRLLATTAARQQGAVRFYPAAGYTETSRSTTGEYELIDFEKSL